MKLKGIELLSNAAQLEIDTHRAIKANKRKSIFQHKSGGSSEGAGLRPEVLDEPIGKSAISDEGVGTSPEGSTDDETFLFDEKEENPKDISWVSTDEDEYDDKEKEDDESIAIETTDDEKTDIDVEDQVKGVAEMNIVEEAEEENAEKVEELKAYEELKANEEQQGDDQAGDEQVGVPVSTTHKEKPNLLQSTSSHSVSSNFSNQFINSPNASLISTIPENTEVEINSLLDIQIQQDVPNIQQEPFHAVKVSVIPEPKIPPSTSLASPLTATITPVVPVPNLEAFNYVVQRVSELEKDVNKLKQVNHSITILESIRSEVPEAGNKYFGSTLRDTLQKVLQRHTEELRHEFSQKTICQTHTKDLNMKVSQDDVSKFIKVKQKRAAQEKMPKYLTTLYDQAAEDEHKQKEILF
ncbi:hypothetical protein Tco_0111007 [Tanacetum coccineum]